MKEFDRYNDIYRDEIDKAVAFSGQSHDFYIKVKARFLLDLLGRMRAQSGAGRLRALDVGCGHGYIHPFLTAAGADLELTGIDVAGGVLDGARKANPAVRYDVYDGRRLPYEAGSFDAAFTIAVMHHVPAAEWGGFLAEMRRVVKPGGLIAVIEHNPINPLTRWIVRTCPLDKNAVLLPSGQVARLLRDAGLVNIERRYILFTPFEGRFFRKLDDWLGWLPLGAQYCMTARVP